MYKQHFEVIIVEFNFHLPNRSSDTGKGIRLRTLQRFSIQASQVVMRKGLPLMNSTRMMLQSLFRMKRFREIELSLKKYSQFCSICDAAESNFT